MLVDRDGGISWCRGSMVDWGSMVDRGRGRMVYRCSMVDWGRGRMVDRGRGSRVGGGVFGGLGLTGIGHISDIAILGGSVDDSLSTAVRKGNRVAASCIVAITLLVGVEVDKAVVVLDSIAVLVDRGEVWVCRRGRAVGGNGGNWEGGGHSHEGGGEENLESHDDVLDCEDTSGLEYP